MGMIISLLMLTACSQLPAETAQDFSVTYSWNTGTLPPEYTYTCTIILGPGAQGKLEYQPGYWDDNAQLWSVDFPVSEREMDNLYQYLYSQDMFRRHWKKGEISEGGPGTSLELRAYGKQYEIPSLSIIASSEFGRVSAAMEAIRALVPQTIWNEMDARQEEWEANYEE
jgi:hypothetical protein